MSMEVRTRIESADLQQAFAQAKSSLGADASAAATSLVDHALRDFHLAGVDLPDAEKSRFKAIMQDLAATQASFEHNVQGSLQGPRPSRSPSDQRSET